MIISLRDILEASAEASSHKRKDLVVEALEWLSEWGTKDSTNAIVEFVQSNYTDEELKDLIETLGE